MCPIYGAGRDRTSPGGRGEAGGGGRHLRHRLHRHIYPSQRLPAFKKAGRGLQTAQRRHIKSRYWQISRDAMHTGPPAELNSSSRVPSDRAEADSRSRTSVRFQLHSDTGTASCINVGNILRYLHRRASEFLAKEVRIQQAAQSFKQVLSVFVSAAITCLMCTASPSMKQHLTSDSAVVAGDKVPLALASSRSVLNEVVGGHRLHGPGVPCVHAAAH